MTDAPAPYRVLARKYRPQDFSGLIGQEAMVRTLSNAILSGRIAHAFILTGVRGVGKTTTARIIARALNCTGPDGTGGPTIAPCGQCDSCRAIAEDRHVDVLEMDAASRTGIGDIREIIESVRYAPASARYKIYIIDEVHMLSTAAFNGLLKTLEEPPAHVKFIFATTEIRKVPVTVLSRCQRFDLRRVEGEVLGSHLAAIAKKEGIGVEEEALALIARAAEGSVRDALSLLDQAIAHAGDEAGVGTVRAGPVRAMLGLTDRSGTFDLYELLMRGEVAAALAQFGRQYEAGADPVSLIEDLLDITHWLTRLKITPELAEDPTLAEAERMRGRGMAAALSMPVLVRSWQMLLKGLAEVRAAPLPLAAAEMVLVRLCYVADLPPPGELMQQLKTGGTAPARATGAPAAPLPSAPVTKALAGQASAARAPAPQVAVAATPAPVAGPESFSALLDLAQAQREGMLKAKLVNYVHLVRFEPGRIEFRPAAGAPADLAADLARALAAWTGRRWMVSVSAEPGAPTEAMRLQAAAASRREAAADHPLVRAALEMFPEAAIGAVRDLPAPEFGAPGEAAEAEGMSGEAVDGESEE